MGGGAEPAVRVRHLPRNTGIADWRLPIADWEGVRAARSRDAATELLADHECTGRLRRIRLFADSNSDWLDWPTDVLAGALDAIRQADNLDVILCTKWPELFAEKIKAAWWKAEGLAADGSAGLGSAAVGP